MTGAGEHVVRLSGVSLSYGATHALDDITLDIPAGVVAGLIGPDGVGKSSLLSLVAGARAIQNGGVFVLGGDMSDSRHRRRTCPRIAYMPQGLGKNLYPTLSVFENVEFFGRLFGRSKQERDARIAQLLARTGLAPFADRPMLKLSGGMKQKLGLCCALIHDPDLLVLDEPTTGVDPLSRQQFWALIDSIRRARPGISILVATSYMEEAEGFDWLVAMNAGSILATGTPGELLEKSGEADLDAAFISLLPPAQREGHTDVVILPRRDGADAETVIEADHLTMHFGDFTAVDDVSFRIARGEIFGFLGSNGCGKTTTMKMLTGLLAASQGSARLFGRPVDATDMELRHRVGYMSQSFSLYSELTVRENLQLHARLFGMPADSIAVRIRELSSRFGLEGVINAFHVTLGMMNFLLLTAFATFFFEVPFKGSFLAFSTGALFYVAASTGMGLFISSFMKSQIAAIFATTLLTLIPAVQFSGMIEPVSSLQGLGAVIGQIYPTAYFMNITRGTFSKALELSDLTSDLLAVLLAVPVFLGLATFLLKKQAA
jgi:ribosome-dependent ATPase